MKKILSQVLEKIRPTSEEEEELLSYIGSVIKKIKIKDAKIELGGSGAKKTFLKDACDADVFVKFDYSKYQKKPLSDILEKHLKKQFKNLLRLHGSRDYFQLTKDGFTFEFIPILNIKKAEHALNITDVSPLHAEWVLRNSTKEIRDQIRLTKQFCKAQKVYGAESYIKGFSGYICEILTIYYKSFEKLLKASLRWKDKVVIDPEKYHKNAKFELNKSKLVSPIIIIDPVQKDRNAAAALSYEKYESFREAARRFLKTPKIDLFQIKDIDEESLRKKYSKGWMIFVDVKAKKGKPDVVGSKILKVYEFILKRLEKSEFKIIMSDWEYDRRKTAKFFFAIKKERLSDLITVSGPPIKNIDHVKRFKAKYKKTFTKSNKLYSNVKRRYKEPLGLIRSLIDKDYITERIEVLRCRQ